MIEINNLTAVRIDEEFLREISQKVLREEKRGKANLSVALVGQRRIRELNKKYRGKNRVTDVLSFPDGEMGLGEIVICPGEVKRNAKRFNLTFEKELVRVLIHGILHLLGYGHEKSETETKKIEEKQNYYLLQLKI